MKSGLSFGSLHFGGPCCHSYRLLQVVSADVIESVNPFLYFCDKSQVVKNEIHEVAVDSASGDLVLQEQETLDIDMGLKIGYPNIGTLPGFGGFPLVISQYRVG